MSLILVVEDEDRLSAERILQARGHLTTFANTIEQAITILDGREKIVRFSWI